MEVLAAVTVRPFSEHGECPGDSGHICCCNAQLQKTKVKEDEMPEVLKSRIMSCRVLFFMTMT